MKRIEELREEIRKTDQQMAELFQKRMAVVREVAACKKEQGLLVKDIDQEKRIIEKNLSLIGDETLKPYYLVFLRNVIDLSCSYQEHLIGGR